MATWTAEKRLKLPLSNFGAPESRAFPVEDQEDLDNAARLLGHTSHPEKVKTRLIAIAKRLGLKLPKSWQDDAAKMSADDPTPNPDGETIAMFDLGTAIIKGDEVRYEDALLFKVGDYPDRDFSLNTEEAWLAIERFDGPKPNELEHVNSFGFNTILDGKFGEVRSLRLSEDGEEVRGEVAIPGWLDALWEGRRSVSAVWDRVTKDFKKLGLVIQGRVNDAVLMAAFSAAHPDDAEALFTVANQSPHGRAMLQQVHDLVVTGGAICSPANSPSANPEPSLTDPPAFTARIERSILQTIHNQAVRGGATCVIAPRGTVAMAAEPAGPAPSPPAPAAPVGTRNPAPPRAPARMGAGVPPSQKGKIMGLKDSFMALFGTQPEAAPDEARVDAFLAELTTTMQPPNPQAPAPAAFCADEAAVKAKDARIAELEQKLNQIAEKSGNPASFADSPEARALLLKIEEANAKIVEQDRKAFVREVGLAAAAFADGEIKECRALPAERADLVVLFTQAMLDDAEHATAVTFGADGQPVTTPRVATLKALYAKRPKHSLMREFIRAEDMPPGSSVLFHQAEAPKNGKPTQERIDELLSKTPEGLQAIKLRNRGA